MHMLVLVTVEAGPCMNEDCRNGLRFLAHAEDSLESPVRAMRCADRAEGLSIAAIGHIRRDGISGSAGL